MLKQIKWTVFFSVVTLEVLWCSVSGQKKKNKKKGSLPRWPVTNGHKRLVSNERTAARRVYTDCRILKGTVRFYWIILGRRGRGGSIKILDGNEPPEVISFRLLFHRTLHARKQLFLLCYVNFFFGPPPTSSSSSRGQMRIVFLYILYEVQNGKKKKKKRLCNCNYCIIFLLFTFLLRRLFHYFDYKTWLGNKKKKKPKPRGSFNQIDVGFDSGGKGVAFAVLRPRFFLVKTFLVFTIIIPPRNKS